MRKPPSFRIALLLTLLVGETALVFSLRLLGWHETGGAIRWISALGLAVLPLGIAAILLVHRFRFGLRTLLVATALVALFLTVTVMPLQNALSSRRMSQRLLAAGASLHTASPFEDVYKRWGYDPRPKSPSPAEERELSVWLRPLAGDLLTIPTDDVIRQIWFDSDAQISILCRDPRAFRNLEGISVSQAVTPTGMEMLRRSLRKFTYLTYIHIDVDVPKGWLRSLEGITTLDLWGEQRRPGSRLSGEHLHDIAALRDLRVLWIFKYATNDADVEVLSRCKSLKHLILRKTAVTELGEQRLSAALPNCAVDRE